MPIVVFEHRTGSRAGLREICGRWDRKNKLTTPIDFERATDTGKESVTAALVTAGSNYVLYREVDTTLPPRI